MRLKSNRAFQRVLYLLRLKKLLRRSAGALPAAAKNC